LKTLESSVRMPQFGVSLMVIDYAPRVVNFTPNIFITQDTVGLGKKKTKMTLTEEEGKTTAPFPFVGQSKA
jgi:hypothetical protein